MSQKEIYEIARLFLWFIFYHKKREKKSETAHTQDLKNLIINWKSVKLGIFKVFESDINFRKNNYLSNPSHLYKVFLKFTTAKKYNSIFFLPELKLFSLGYQTN